MVYYVLKLASWRASAKRQGPYLALIRLGFPWVLTPPGRDMCRGTVAFSKKPTQQARTVPFNTIPTRALAPLRALASQEGKNARKSEFLLEMCVD